MQELWVAAQALNSGLKEALVHGRTRTLMPELMSVLHLSGKCYQSCFYSLEVSAIEHTFIKTEVHTINQIDSLTKLIFASVDRRNFIVPILLKSQFHLHNKFGR